MTRAAATTASPAFVLEGDAALSPARAGGKGAALAALADSFPVPRFFVIPSDAFTGAGLRDEALGDVSDALGRLGPGPFAVRSSGVEEDGAGAAHAGQFETELDVRAADVPAAAFRVWRSGFGATLAAYREARGLDAAPQPPAVVVQVMVRPRAAGVAFSACPVTGDREVVVISAVAGLADRLVAGEVDGDSYRVASDGRTLEAQLASDGAVLGEPDRALVADLARRAAGRFGAPQDIEWAIAGEEIFLLQSRPITTLPPRGAADDAALTIWDNSNIIESYPGVVSPLTYSFARYVYAHVYRAFSGLMGVSGAAIEASSDVFENMLGRVDGRVYYNLVNWYRALALFPGFRSNRRFMEQMMGVAEALPEEIALEIAPEAKGRAVLFDGLRLARVGAGLLAHALQLPRTRDRFCERLETALATADAEILVMPATALARAYRRLEQLLLSRWDAPLVNDFLCMIAFGASRKLLESWAGPDGAALHSDMMIGQGDIVSAEPARLIRAMGVRAARDPALTERLAAGERAAVDADPELEAQLEAYLAKFGDRCTQELKLESLTLHEDPRPVLMAIAAAAGASARSAPREESDVSDRFAALFVGKPIKRRLAGLALRWAKARVRDRENLRFERTRIFGRVRRIFLALGDRLAAGGLLDEPRDVLFLTVEEVLGAVEGGAVTADLRGLVALRRAEDAASRARPGPPERFTVRGAHLTGVRTPAPVAPPHEDGPMRKGLACCAGVVTARVRVVEDPRTEALAPGEILVARHTDPGWIAVFANAAGVIAERGSLLSHSAIVAREMGVPCVVALKGATTWLATGDVVRLDGGRGVVEKLGEGA